MMETMARVLFVASAVLAWCCVGTAAMTQDVYPGLRRAPQAKISTAAGGAASSNPYDENYLSQILNFIELQARRRFQEKFKNRIMPMDMEEQVVPDEWQDDRQDGDFTFKMPSSGREKIPAIDEPFDFGVAPNDPRFYETENVANTDQVQEANNLDGLEKSAEGPYMRIKDPLIVNPKPDPNSFYKAKQMQGLLHKWGRNNNIAAGTGLDSRLGLPGAGVAGGQEVVQRPVNLGEQTSISIYGVALIAGISAAITIALIALGVGWWTFYKKSKAAQDVEYPAYGVTGPNKEKFSPSSGDRRLAQNAQMYHYQHQKQQIIAMENKMNEDRNGSLSDAANSEDEEGDYTVYECPGLAPTGGEMEVKNPLFFDDPTPATPTQGTGGGNNNNSTSSANAPPTTTTTTKAQSKAPSNGEKRSQKK